MLLVAPLVGAWIEIKNRGAWTMRKLSLLSWERGLKSKQEDLHDVNTNVAPLVGAWIEIE